jgi:hypothetical protein
MTNMVSFKNLMIDVCGRTVTVHKSSKVRLINVLNALGISHQEPPIGHPFQNATLQLSTEEDLNLFLLATYGEMVDSTTLCRRPPPIVKNINRQWFASPPSFFPSPSPSPSLDVLNPILQYLNNSTFEGF